MNNSFKTLGMSNSISPCKNQRSAGIRIVDNNKNKRVSDIFNTKCDTYYQNSTINKNNKSRIIEVTEKIMEDKMRTITPYINGQKNYDYFPQHLNSSIDFTLQKDNTSTTYKNFLKSRIQEKPTKRNIPKSSNISSRNNIFPLNDELDLNLNKSYNGNFHNKTNVLQDQNVKTLIKSTSQNNIISKSNISQNKNVPKDDFKIKTLDELNERNKQYTENKKNAKLKIQQERIQNATLSLISSTKSQKDLLSKKFQNSKGLFDSEFRKDHILEKAKIKINQMKNANNTIGKQHKILAMDQRLEIIEYYEMNQKLIEKNTNQQKNEKESDTYFEDVKKINEQLLNENKLKKENSQIVGKKTNIPIKTSRQANTINHNDTNPETKLKRDLSVVRGGKNLTSITNKNINSGSKTTRSKSAITGDKNQEIKKSINTKYKVPKK